MQDFRGSFRRFVYRTLRVDILTLFLTLLSVSFFLVISFNYWKSSKSILGFAGKEAKRVSRATEEEAKDLALNISRLIDAAPSLFSGCPNNCSEMVSFAKDTLGPYMLNVIKFNHNISSFSVATQEGDMIQMANQMLSTQTHFLSDPSKPLPKETRYAIRVIDRSHTPPKEEWCYKDEELQTLACETIREITYEPRGRPWYTGAAATTALYWTPIYHYEPTGELGISVSKQIATKDHKFLGVIGADLSFVLLEKFLSEQKIGKSGRVFILDKTGQVFLPKMDKEREASSPISPEIIAAAYQAFAKNHNPSLVFEYKNTEYLAYINPLPAFTQEGWWIALIAPLSDFFDEMLKTQKRILLITCIILFATGALVIQFSKRISRPIVSLSKEVDKIRKFDLESTTRVRSTIKEIILMDSSISALRVAIRSFARYVPREIVKQLIQKGEEIVLGGEKKEIAVLFSDIVGFTSIVEIHSTETFMPLLSAYFSALSEIILERQGTIDKYIGDSIMAFWGAPLIDPELTAHACTTALLCQAYLSKFNVEQHKEGKLEFPTRFGIDTGLAVVGNIGTSERMNYTAIGDVVNMASRLQQEGRVYQVPIIVSENIYQKIKNLFLIRPLDIITVRGKKEKSPIYELMAKSQGEEGILATPEKKELSASFTKGYEAFHQGRIEEAKALFQAVHQKFPSDPPTNLYLERIVKDR